MTWGNFQRASLGYIKRSWVVGREVIAAIVGGRSRETIRGEDVFPFGLTRQEEAPSEESRAMMDKRYKHLKSIRDGRQKDQRKDRG